MSAFTIHTMTEGNLVSDPVLRETSAKKPVCNFRIAVTQRLRVNGNEFVDRTEYLDVVAWGDMAVNAHASFHKGTRVIVAGDIRERSYETTDGSTRYVRELHADMLGVSTRWHVVAGIEKAKDALAQPELVEA